MQLQTNALAAYNYLLKQGITTELEFNCLAQAEIRVHEEKDIRKIKGILAKFGFYFPKLEKKAFISQDGQFARGYTEDRKAELVIFANGVFNGCHIETTTETIEVPEQHIEAHTETVIKKKIVCGKQEE